MVRLWAVGGSFSGAPTVSAGVLLARGVPGEVRGHGFAVFGGVANGANATGYLLAGVALAAVSPRSLIALAGGVGLGVALAFAVPLLKAAAGDQPAAVRGPQVVLAHD